MTPAEHAKDLERKLALYVTEDDLDGIADLIAAVAADTIDESFVPMGPLAERQYHTDHARLCARIERAIVDKISPVDGTGRCPECLKWGWVLGDGCSSCGRHLKTWVSFGPAAPATDDDQCPALPEAVRTDIEFRREYEAAPGGPAREAMLSEWPEGAPPPIEDWANARHEVDGDAKTGTYKRWIAGVCQQWHRPTQKWFDLGDYPEGDE